MSNETTKSPETAVSAGTASSTSLLCRLGIHRWFTVAAERKWNLRWRTMYPGSWSPTQCQGDSWVTDRVCIRCGKADRGIAREETRVKDELVAEAAERSMAEDLFKRAE